jgi:hypothetical protein
MRLHRVYGRGVDDTSLPLPGFESFKYRALRLKYRLGLCEFCLRGNRRCYESPRWDAVQPSWKRHRTNQFRV